MDTRKIVSSMQYGEVFVAENASRQYAVIGKDGREVVPFGRYAYISGFDGGLARVRTMGIRYNDPCVVAVFDPKLNRVFKGGELNEYYEILKTGFPEILSRWGIINCDGEEVLKPVYDEVWNFYGKQRKSTRICLNGTYSYVQFKNLPGSAYYEPCYDQLCRFEDDYGIRFGEFEGSYAQDVMGFSDDVINDAFEGDPDLYWNID